MRKPKLFPWSLILPLVLTATLYSVLDGNEANSQEKTPARGTASVDAPAPESSFAPSAAGTSSEAPKPEAHRRSKEEGCLTDPLAIEDLHKKSDELDARSKEFVAKDAELKAREKALEEELARLHSIRDEIAKIDDARKKENDERVSKIVTTVETMSPKAASQLLGTLEDSLAVATMGRMDTTKLAKVMNIMEPSRSARLTELLAGVARARRIVPPITPAVNTTSNDVANPSAKGGERDNGQNQQQQQQQYNRSSGSGERIPSSIRGTIAAPSAGKGKGTQ